MTKSTILLSLAAAFLALAIFSAHTATATVPSPVAKKQKHHAPPHSVATAHPPSQKHHAHKKRRSHLAPPQSRTKRHPHRHAAPAPEAYAFDQSCFSTLMEGCGGEIFRGILGGDYEISERCCVKAAAMGRQCRRWVVKAVLTLPELTRREKNEIKKRSGIVWDRCAVVSDALKFGDGVTPAPSPLSWFE